MELVDRYGLGTVNAAYEDLLDYSERLMRQAIAALPDGVYRATTYIDGYLDADEDTYGDSAVDGPYSIEDVPYVMYFHGAYALHSAFWHDRFGHTKSHGCVNVAPLDARWLFRWTGPHLEAGWHGAFPTEANPAAWVIIRGETPVG